MNRILLFLFSVIFFSLIGNMAKAEPSLKYNKETLALSAPEGASYRWYFNGELLDGVTSRQIVASQGGRYSVEITANDGSVEQYSYTVSSATKPTVFVIGDSTASVYASSLFPRTGWAQVLQPFFLSDSITVNDQAASGRSSKSFYDEGKWNTVYNLLKAGDYVFIQFAHNDEKTTDATRYTDPSTTYKQYITLFIDSTRLKGAYPVLFSSIPRNNWSGSSVQQSHAAYTAAMKEVAAALNVPFVDMEASTMAYLNSVGKTYATDSVYNNLPAGVYSGYPSGNSDGTHLQENGAFHFCKIAVEGLTGVTGYAEVAKLAACTTKALRVSAMPSPNLSGTITGAGVVMAHSTVTLKATAATNYRFVKWSSASDTVTVSTSSTYSFASDTSNVSLTAWFESTEGSVSLQSNDGFKVYPNPVSDFLTIETQPAKFSVEVFDLNGRTVLRGENSTIIDVRTLNPGLYIIKVTDGMNVCTNRIQVAR
jgi:lysophospholipase L1-like esterase